MISASGSKTSINILVSAKINLYLRVLDRRRDGFHSIETVFHTIGLFDEIRLEPADRLVFTTRGLPSPRDNRNTCVRAFHLMLARARGFGARRYDARRCDARRAGAAIHLLKRIPSGAGLGGGSADGAACLYGLNQLWNLDLRLPELKRIAAKLGSDVPFFLARSVAAIATGRGEKLKVLASRIKAWAIVLKPRLTISTAEAYRSIDAARRKLRPPGTVAVSLSTVARATRTGNLSHLDVWNDFQSLTEARHPKIHALREALVRAGAFASFMTGSGSAVIGLVKTRSRAKRIARALSHRLRVTSFVAPLATEPLRVKSASF